MGTDLVAVTDVPTENPDPNYKTSYHLIKSAVHFKFSGVPHLYESPLVCRKPVETEKNHLLFRLQSQSGYNWCLIRTETISGCSFKVVFKRVDDDGHHGASIHCPCSC